MADEDRSHVGQALTTLRLCALYRRTVVLTCAAGHVRRLDAIALWWMFEVRGWNDRLPGAWRRLYCLQCLYAGRRTPFRAEITRDPPDQSQPPYPDDRTWRRLVARHRA